MRLLKNPTPPSIFLKTAFSLGIAPVFLTSARAGAIPVFPRCPPPGIPDRRGLFKKPALERPTQAPTLMEAVIHDIGDPKMTAQLDQLDRAVPWEQLAAPIPATYRNTSAAGGRPNVPPPRVVMMLKVMMLQKWFNLRACLKRVPQIPGVIVLVTCGFLGTPENRPLTPGK